MNQKGFATLEVILMVTVIGILAAIAVPRFTDVTTKANTAKIQSDLATLDSAIQLYYMEEGKYPSDVPALKDYVNDAGSLQPPQSGKFYAEGTEKDIPSGGYTISNGRAMLGTYTAGQIGKNAKATNGGNS